MHKPQIAVALGALVSGLGLATTIGAGPAGAGGPPVIHPPVPLATTVSACGTLANPGQYILSADLKQSNGPCLVITAPRVTLDLAGQTLTGPWEEVKGPVILPPG